MSFSRSGLVALLSLFLSLQLTLSAPTVHRISRQSAQNATTPPAFNLTAPPPHRMQDFNITMRTLLLSSDPTLSVLPKTIMNAYGHPFTAIELFVNGSLTDPDNKFISTLVDDKGVAQYNSIVLQSATLGYPQANGTWTSTLSHESWKRLYDYASKYSVRIVSLQSTPGADPGLRPAPGFEKGMTGNAILTFGKDNYTSELLANIKQDAVFKVGQVSEFVFTSYWWNPAFLRPNVTNVKPFLYINPTKPILNPACNATLNVTNSSDTTRSITLENTVNCSSNQDENMVSNPNWVGAVVREVDGREEMHFLINSNQYGHHGFVLANVWLQWAVRGLWLGQRRLLLDTQVDDIFLSTRVYNTTYNRPADESEPAYRTSLEDYRQLHKYQLDVNTKRVPGSRFVVQLAFNGLGWFANEYQRDSVNIGINEIRDYFFWLSHTWSHLDMYCYNSNCNLKGNTQYNDTLWDLQKNEWFAENVLYENVPTDMFAHWPTYSQHSLVTPRISGLNLTDSIQAMWDAGINNTVGDNSRKDLAPPNPYHAFPSPARDHKNRSVLVIPRQATRIYFDVSTAEESSWEHSSIYGPKCVGFNRTGEVTFPWKCNTTTFKYPRRLTLEDILEIEGFEVVRNLLAWRHDPYMFHQANLKFFDHNGKNVTLLTLWVDSVLGYITNYTSMPVYTYKMDDLQALYNDRMKRDTCGLVGVTEYRAGKVYAVRVSGNDTCVAKISRVTRKDGSDPLQMAGEGVEEVYGLDRTRDVPVSADKPATVLFGSSNQVTLRANPIYPMVNETMTAFLATQAKQLNANRFETAIVRNMSATETQMQQLLAQEILPIVELHKEIGAVRCRDGKDGQKKTEVTIERASSLYYELSLPAKDARAKNVPVSWYLRMEQALENTSLALNATAKQTIPDEMDVVDQTIREHKVKAIDRSENFATVFFRRRYSVFLDLKNRFWALPKCEDGQKDPVPESESMNFSVAATSQNGTDFTVANGSGMSSGDLMR